MQLKPFVSHDFNKMIPNEKVLFGINVVNLLTEHAAHFPHLPFSVVQLNAVNEDLRNTYAAYKLQGAIAKGALLQAEETWKTLFTRTAQYVNLVADGRLAVINLSGFHSTKTEAIPAERLEQPVADMEISNNERGMVTASAKAVAGARGYYFGVVTPDVEVNIVGNQLTFKMGDSFVSIIIGTKREVKFQNLPSAEGLASVAAFNTAGLSTFSNVIGVRVP